MLRVTRSSVPLVASLVVATGLLAGCGDSTPGTGLAFGDRLDAVTVEGDIGAATIDFSERMEAGDLEGSTTITGQGDALADGDQVFVNYAIASGYSQQTTLDSFGPDNTAIDFTVGEEIAEPATLDDLVANVLDDYIKAGTTTGSRIVVTGSSVAMFGDAAGAQQLAVEGIGNDDGLILVADVMDVTILDGPEGDSVPFPAWAPKFTFNGNGLTGFDFKGIDKPAPKAAQEVVVLKKGTGAKVADGDLLVANYMLTPYGTATPVEETYSSEPAQVQAGGFPLDGVNELLEGQTVGSRVLMRIPPAKGYGAEAQGDAIPANSTLYFVIDILAAV